MERYDRWGSARAPAGPPPEAFCTPWVLARVHTSALVSNGAAIGPDNIGYFANWQENLIIKFDRRTGQDLGSFNALNFVTSFPALGNDYLFACSDHPDNGKLFALDTRLMDFEWFRPIGFISNSDYERTSPIIGPDGNVLVCSKGGFLKKYRSSDGSLMWQSAVSSAYRTPCMSRDDGLVFVAGPTRLFAIDYLSGIPLWSREFGSTLGNPSTAPDGTLLVGSGDGYVNALIPQTGATRWTRQTLAAVIGAPAATDSVVYACSTDNRLYAIRLSDGVRLWSYQTSNPFFNGPVLGHDGSIYAINRSADLYKFRPDGSLIWSYDAPAQTRGNFSLDEHGTIYMGGSDGRDGLVMIRQQPEVEPVVSYSYIRGTHLSGNEASLTDIDGDYLVSGPGATIHASDPPIQLVLNGNTNRSNVLELRFTTRLSVSTAGLRSRISFYNFRTNLWDSVDERDAPTSDTTIRLTVSSDVGRYIEGTSGALRVKVSVFQSRPPVWPGWKARFDLASWGVVPTFQL